MEKSSTFTLLPTFVVMPMMYSAKLSDLLFSVVELMTHGGTIHRGIDVWLFSHFQLVF